jgi:hypothetical protein
MGVYLRSLLNTFLEGIADHTVLSASLGLLHELVVDALVHERPRPSAAALPLLYVSETRRNIRFRLQISEVQSPDVIGVQEVN